jgi:hypothetical protein
MAEVEQGAERIRLPFQLIGEVPAEHLPGLARYMGQLGVTIRAATEEIGIVSPSILIEYVEGVDHLAIPAVSESTIYDYLMSEGWADHTAKTRSTTLGGELIHHAARAHNFSKPGKRRRNLYGRDCEDCPCPLRAVARPNRLSDNGISAAGVTPQSLVDLAKLDLPKINLLIMNFGTKSYALLQKMAARITDDTRTS